MVDHTDLTSKRTMPSSHVKKGNNVKNLGAVAGLLMIVIVVIFLVFRQRPTDEDKESYFVEVDISTSTLPIIRSDYDLFKHPTYVELRSYSELPIDVGPMGRENPFKPFDIEPPLSNDDGIVPITEIPDDVIPPDTVPVDPTGDSENDEPEPPRDFGNK
jgi:hypothetical protein